MKPLLFIVLVCLSGSLALWSQSQFRPEIPRVWDEAALSDWVTPAHSPGSDVDELRAAALQVGLPHRTSGHVARMLSVYLTLAVIFGSVLATRR